MIVRSFFPVLVLFASGIMLASLRAHGFMVGGLLTAGAHMLKRSPGVGSCSAAHKGMSSVASALEASMGEKEPIQQQLGRVTVYTKERCPYCVRVLQLLEGEYGLTVNRIDLLGEDSENKINQMRTFSGGRMTVPQVFFNSLHLGGNDDVQQLHMDGKLKTLVQTVCEEEAGTMKDSWYHPWYVPFLHCPKCLLIFDANPFQITFHNDESPQRKAPNNESVRMQPTDVLAYLEHSVAASVHPFRNVASWLQVLSLNYNVNQGLAEADIRSVRRGITALSNSQSTLKGMYGATHTLSSSHSTKDLTDKAKPLSTTEVTRLTELLEVAEMGLDAAELVECGTVNDMLSKERSQDRGLEPLPAPSLPIRQDNASDSSQCSNIAPNCSTENEILSSQPKPAPEASSDLELNLEMDCSSFVPLVLFKLKGGGLVTCRSFVDVHSRRVVLSFSDTLEGANLLSELEARPRGIRLASHGLVEETISALPSVIAAAVHLHRKVGGPAVQWLTAANMENPKQRWTLHCVGHSFAGSVAAVVAGMLEGSLTLEGQDRSGITPIPGAVTCVAFGPPPCISHAVNIPFVTSFVLGDDMVPRVNRASLLRLKTRLAQVIPRRAGGPVAHGLVAGSGIFRDVASMALGGLKRYGIGEYDDDELTVPGEVWFLKPRRKMGVATMARAFSGSLSELLLWQMRDIVLTKSMLSHHSLHKYIETLDKV